MQPHLILVSGLLSDETLWKHQEAHLSDITSIQIVCPSADTPEGMVQQVLEKAPPSFALAGHSMGGWLCLELLRKAPTRVKKLCLLNTTARADSSEKRLKRQKLILDAEQGHFFAIAKEIAKKFVFSPSIRPQVEQMFLKVGKEAFIRQEKAMLARNSDFSFLSQVSCPTLVVHAMQDENFSLEEHEELALQIKGAKLAIIEGSGHMSPMERPEEVTSLLRSWLTRF